MKNVNKILTIAIVVLLIEAQSQAPPSPCDQWIELTRKINEESRQNMLGGAVSLNCTKHYKDCQQLDCSGYNSQPFNINFTGGVKLNSCDKPVSMDVHFNIPSKNIALKKKIQEGTETIAIPGLSYHENKTRSEFSLYMVVSLNSPKKSDKMTPKYVTLNVTFAVKVSVGDLFDDWPDSLKLPIIPTTNFTLLDCGKNGTEPTYKPPPGVSTSAPGPPHINSAYYMKNCTMSLHSRCGPNEMCQQRTANTGICICQPENYMCDAIGYCVSEVDCFGHKAPTTVPSVTARNSQTTPETAKTSISYTALIVGSVLGGIVLIVILAVLIVYFRKRGNSRYHGRQLLLTEDDTDGII